jgi:ribulose-bisphosphate carboxylase large chain
LELRDKAEDKTGEKKVYLPNITAEAGEMLGRGVMVNALGGEYVMVDIITAGWSALQSVRQAELGAIHAHRAMHGAFTEDPRHGISMLAVAKFARAVGVDQLHIGTAVGKMKGSRQEVMDIRDVVEEKHVKPNAKHHVLEQDWGKVKPVMAVASGGVHPGMVPALVDIMGSDVIIQMGGGIHGHPKGTRKGAKAARDALDAVMQGVSLEESKSPELKQALRQWKQKEFKY